MGVVLDFRPGLHKPGSPASSGHSGGGKVVLFTGIFYDRTPDAGPKAPVGRTRRVRKG